MPETAQVSPSQASHIQGTRDRAPRFRCGPLAVAVDHRQLKPGQPLRLRAQPFAAEATPAAPFARLGLPEPDSLCNVREGQVFALCKGDLNWLDVAVAQIDERSSRGL
ncbi:hypothetical protein AB0O22_09995 [Streptomyces sp. NPDC091204]|uniref:hypothetical protein n=1 Tax=Streptomyces sp. NPDC091204 TaxID=3155299 RepID=UPI0034382C44